MLELIPEDENYLRIRISLGEGVLVFGAGAVGNCNNARGMPLKSGSKLAEEISTNQGYDYGGEPLDIVLDAVKLPTAQLNDLLANEYLGCSPSNDLKNVFSVPWRRIYTFNIDDTIEAVQGTLSKQLIYSYNAMHSKVAAYEGPKRLHVVHLNGYVRELDKGVIFSKLDYDKRLPNADTGWYREASEDHFRYCSIFIGTQLREPLLWSELERMRDRSNYSRAFLVIPDALSSIERASYASRGITVLRGTFEDFVQLTQQLFPRKLEWTEIVAKESGVTLPKDLRSFTREDVETLQNAKLIDPAGCAAKWRQTAPPQRNIIARDFFMGRPPSWELATSDVPADLTQSKTLRKFILEALNGKARLAVVVGQAGCGKTTGTMRELLEIVRTNDDIDLIEISLNVVSLGKLIRASRKFSTKKRSIFYMPDLFPFTTALTNDLQEITTEDALIVTTARESEWHGHYKRTLGHLASVQEFKRFSSEDEPGLIRQLEKYVPSPEFAKLSRADKLARLRKSSRQLLIALREVTDSPQFDDVIRDEFIKLDHDDKKFLFLIAALGSLARTGVRLEMAYSAYQSVQPKLPFKEALEGLTGVVFSNNQQRLFARHDIYARLVLETVAPFREIRKAISAILLQFSSFEVPIIRHVPRLDSALFKYLQNHNFIFELADAHDVKEDGLKVYEGFEVPFQLDGHFWLQYGLYYDRLGDLNNAENMLGKSIAAYPENVFAEHALARLRLRIAASHDTDEPTAKRLILDAVSALNRLDARDQSLLDEYPLVTLSFFHIHTLLKRGQREEAKVAARDYLSRLNYMQKRISADNMTRTAIEQLTIFLATGDWRPQREAN